jgi:hypothetical protein
MCRIGMGLRRGTWSSAVQVGRVHVTTGQVVVSCLGYLLGGLIMSLLLAFTNSEPITEVAGSGVLLWPLLLWPVYAAIGLILSPLSVLVLWPVGLVAWGTVWAVRRCGREGEGRA